MDIRSSSLHMGYAGARSIHPPIEILAFKSSLPRQGGNRRTSRSSQITLGNCARGEYSATRTRHGDVIVKNTLSRRNVLNENETIFVQIRAILLLKP